MWLAAFELFQLSISSVRRAFFSPFTCESHLSPLKFYVMYNKAGVFKTKWSTGVVCVLAANHSLKHCSDLACQCCCTLRSGQANEFNPWLKCWVEESTIWGINASKYKCLNMLCKPPSSTMTSAKKYAIGIYYSNMTSPQTPWIWNFFLVYSTRCNGQ